MTGVSVNRSTQSECFHCNWWDIWECAAERRDHKKLYCFLQAMGWMSQQLDCMAGRKTMWQLLARWMKHACWSSLMTWSHISTVLQRGTFLVRLISCHSSDLSQSTILKQRLDHYSNLQAWRQCKVCHLASAHDDSERLAEAIRFCMIFVFQSTWISRVDIQTLYFRDLQAETSMKPCKTLKSYR